MTQGNSAAAKVDRNNEIRRLRSLPAGRRPSLAELGTRFGISRERVSQIEHGRRYDWCSGDVDIATDHAVRIRMVREGEGRFTALVVDQQDSPVRVATVLGGRGKWVAQIGATTEVRGRSLLQIANALASRHVS